MDTSNSPIFSAPQGVPSANYYAPKANEDPRKKLLKWGAVAVGAIVLIVTIIGAIINIFALKKTAALDAIESFGDGAKLLDYTMENIKNGNLTPFYALQESFYEDTKNAGEALEELCEVLCGHTKISGASDEVNTLLKELNELLEIRVEHYLPRVESYERLYLAFFGENGDSDYIGSISNEQLKLAAEKIDKFLRASVEIQGKLDKANCDLEVNMDGETCTALYVEKNNNSKILEDASLLQNIFSSSELSIDYAEEDLSKKITELRIALNNKND